MSTCKRIVAILIVLLFAATAGFAAGQAEAADDDETLQIALLVKSLGNSFFEAARDGAMEAAEELGDVELIYQGPSEPTAEGQVEILDSLIAQGVHATAISANDPDALVPAAQRAQNSGIEVASFDSAVHADGRSIHLAPSDDELIGRSRVQAIAEMIGYEKDRSRSSPLRPRQPIRTRGSSGCRRSSPSRSTPIWSSWTLSMATTSRIRATGRQSVFSAATPISEAL